VSHALYAENYAARGGHRELFRKHLEFGINTPKKVLGDMIPELTLDKKKAKGMLERIQEFF
jgi:hypothetical protein